MTPCRRPAWRALAFVGAVCTGACGFEGLGSGPALDDRNDGAVAPDTGSEGGAPTPDAGGDSDIEVGGDAGADSSTPIVRDDAGCPTGRGPAMMRLFGAGTPALCIDETEVSARQYVPFVAEFKAGRTPAQ